jgi:hypothetical protein
MSGKRATGRLIAGLVGAALIAAGAIGSTAAAAEPESATRAARLAELRATAERRLGSGSSAARETADPILHNVPAGSVGVASSYAFYDEEFDILAFEGEAWNRTAQRRGDIFFEIRLRDSGGVIVGGGFAAAFLYNVAPGARSYLYGEVEAPADDWATYQFVLLDSTAATTPVGGPLKATLAPPFVDPDGHHFPTTVRNLSAFTVKEIFVIVTKYDIQGRVIGVWGNTPNVSVPANETVVVDVVFPITVAGMARYAVDVEGVRNSAEGPYSVDETAYYWPNYFDDIGTSIFRNDILWNADEGITTGCGAGRFCPGSNVARDQMASFLARALGLSGVAPNAFTDDNGNIHEANINRVAAAGITSGCGQNLYCPSANVARDQMASFLARAVGLSGVAPNAFTDDNGNLHEANINRVAAAGITSGCAPNLYCPSALVTRGQMAAFLRRAFDD